MRSLKILFVCFSIILLSFSVLLASESSQNVAVKVSLNSTNETPDVVSILKGVFKRIFHRRKITREYPPLFVKNIIFDPPTVEANRKVNVFVDARDPDGDTLLYKYTVSAGKIVGEGPNVVWDLSGVEKGTYALTIEIDDGCGCVKPVMKSITVVECINCPPPNFTFSDVPMSVGVTSSIRRTRRETLPNRIPVIKNFSLSKTELVANCLTETSKAENALTVDIFTGAEDADGDTLLYKYEVSAGKIIGYGENVVWDLTGVKAGTYAVTFEVDDGCSCFPPIKKSITIVENSDCKNREN